MALPRKPLPRMAPPRMALPQTAPPQMALPRKPLPQTAPPQTALRRMAFRRRRTAAPSCHTILQLRFLPSEEVEVPGFQTFGPRPNLREEAVASCGPGG